MSWHADAGSSDGQAAETRAADPVNLLEPAAGWEPTTSWAGLHCLSAFSFLDGAATPEELVTEAARLGLESLAGPALRAMPRAAHARPLRAVSG